MDRALEGLRVLDLSEGLLGDTAPSFSVAWGQKS